MPTPTPYQPAADRYDAMAYRRTGRSGLMLPEISLGLWQNFGSDRPEDTQRAILRRAFDLGVTHIDLANNYGPPYGAAETALGRIFAEDLRPFRDELVLSTKAGYDMWPGPYGDHGSRKYLLASLDQSLRRMAVDYVDIFYHHRPDPDTPIAETAGALAHAVHNGKALYAGVSSYGPEATAEMADALAEHKVPLLIHQPAYNMLNRGIEAALLPLLEQRGIGAIAFVPLAQGLLTERYLDADIPASSRAAGNGSLSSGQITDAYRERIRSLREIASGRGQSVAQLALSWILRRPEITSALIGASSVAQLEENIATLSSPALTQDEIAALEPLAQPLG